VGKPLRKNEEPQKSAKAQKSEYAKGKFCGDHRKKLAIDGLNLLSALALFALFCGSSFSNSELA
jgi:hypothetical protein